MKKNVLFMVAALLLCGAVSAQNWGTPDAHAKSSNTPIVARVTVDGNAVTPTADYRLGAFVGEELRGLAAPYTEDNNFWIQVFYNQGTSEDITFKLYNGADEYTTCNVTKTTQEEGWGTPSEPVALDFASTQIMTQTTALAAGWNWWSTPIELSNIDGLTMLENSLGHNGITIKSDNATTMNYEYNGSDYWYGSLEDIGLSNEVGYKVNISNACDVSMRGVYANPQDHPITITPNWNWIGYPVNSTQSLTTALANYVPENEDVIKGDGWTSTYYSGYGWFPIYNLTPGHSYLYNSKASDNRILTFANNRGEVITEQLQLYWNANRHAFANNFSVFAVVYIDGKEADDDGYEIGAFVNGECRGSSRLLYFAPLDRYYAMMTVTGENGEKVDFGLIKHNSPIDGNSRSNESITFMSDAIIGTLENPYHISFGTNQQIGALELFPNPVDRNQQFKLSLPFDEQIKKIELINSLGSVVYHEEGAIKTTINGVAVSGVYTIKATCRSGNTYIGRILIK